MPVTTTKTEAYAAAIRELELAVADQIAAVLKAAG